jgi:hypothetical protein
MNLPCIKVRKRMLDSNGKMEKWKNGKTSLKVYLF